MGTGGRSRDWQVSDKDTRCSMPSDKMPKADREANNKADAKSQKNGSSGSEIITISYPPGKPETEAQLPKPYTPHLEGENTRRERQIERSCVDSKACCKYLKWIVMLLVIALIVGYAVAMIVVGAIQLDDCPAESYIVLPIYFLVTGSFSLFTIIACVACCLRKSASGGNLGDRFRCLFRMVFILTGLFFLGWSCAGWFATGCNFKDKTAGNYRHLAPWLVFSAIIFSYCMGAACFMFFSEV